MYLLWIFGCSCLCVVLCSSILHGSILFFWCTNSNQYGTNKHCTAAQIDKLTNVQSLKLVPLKLTEVRNPHFYKLIWSCCFFSGKHNSKSTFGRRSHGRGGAEESWGGQKNKFAAFRLSCFWTSVSDNIYQQAGTMRCFPYCYLSFQHVTEWHTSSIF